MSIFDEYGAFKILLIHFKVQFILRVLYKAL